LNDNHSSKAITRMTTTNPVMIGAAPNNVYKFQLPDGTLGAAPNNVYKFQFPDGTLVAGQAMFVGSGNGGVSAIIDIAVPKPTATATATATATTATATATATATTTAPAPVVEPNEKLIAVKYYDRSGLGRCIILSYEDSKLWRQYTKLDVLTWRKIGTEYTFIGEKETNDDDSFFDDRNLYEAVQSMLKGFHKQHQAFYRLGEPPVWSDRYSS
jgi:hypothetical protein